MSQSPLLKGFNVDSSFIAPNCADAPLSEKLDPEMSRQGQGLGGRSGMWV